VKIVSTASTIGGLDPQLAQTVAAEPEGESAEAIRGRSPWQLAWARLRQDRMAIGSAIGASGAAAWRS